MTVVAVGMCKDEADIAETTLRHMATQVDHLLMADNGSTDGTRDILADLAKELPLTVIDDPVTAYFQSAKMSALAHRAHDEFGATWLAPVDFDEWWFSPFGRIGDLLEELAPQWLTASAVLWDYVATGEDDPDEPNPIRRLGWRRSYEGALPKVACRWREDLVIQQGNHAATYNGGTTIHSGLLQIRHFPYRSVEQMVRKVRNGAAAYAADPAIPAGLGVHWRGWGQLLDQQGENAIAEIFTKWYYQGNPGEVLVIDGEDQKPLVYDPVVFP